MIPIGFRISGDSMRRSGDLAERFRAASIHREAELAGLYLFRLGIMVVRRNCLRHFSPIP